jgi:predicted DsbA family dithiol-disulfide isomerase
VEGDAVDAFEFRELAMRFQVMGVPKIVFNDRVELEGAVPEAVFLKALLQAAAD